MGRSMCSEGSRAKRGAGVKSRRFRLVLAYDGTNYSGWQVQPGLVSVQQVVEEALVATVGHVVKLHGSGRTDAGVHARGQVAHVDLVCRMGGESLLRALNSRLPADIRVLKVRVVGEEFHARRNATSKEYRYYVWNDQIVLPDKRLYHAHVYRKLDIGAMHEAAGLFVGRHDFSAFTANARRDVESTVRTIFSFTVSKRGSEVVFRVRGEGFLYKQVRSMVGFLLRVGEGAERAGAVAELLQAAEPRVARVPTAAGCGLFLWQVWYQPGAGR